MENQIKELKSQVRSSRRKLLELYEKTGPALTDVVLVRAYCFIPSQKVMDRYIQLKIESHERETGHSGTELTNLNKDIPKESSCRYIENILCKKCKKKIVSSNPSSMFYGSVKEKTDPLLLQVYNEFKPPGLFIEKIDKHYNYEINQCGDDGESLIQGDLNFDE